jgi:hypothetical protein
MADGQLQRRRHAQVARTCLEPAQQRPVVLARALGYPRPGGSRRSTAPTCAAST